MNTEKIAWLAGAWDGEGTFGLVRFNGQWFSKERNCYKKENKLKPSITLVNTDIAFINEAIKVLADNGISIYLYEKSKGKKGKDYWKDCYILRAFNFKTIKAVCELLIPYLISKKPHAELLLRFVNARLEKMKDNESGKSTPHYSEEELVEADEIYRKLKNLNMRGKERILTD
jgi:hypothetical protein